MTKPIQYQLFCRCKRYRGAGDSFDAAFLVSILEGKTLPESAKFAAAAAALTCTGIGPLERMPWRQEVEALLFSDSDSRKGESIARV